MRLIALNGFAYPIAKWLSPNVETPYRFNWTCRNTDRLSRSITTPTILVGFSDGATAAMRIACTNPNIVEAYIHSPESYRGPITHVPRLMQFFRTKGDTTPTFYGAINNYMTIEEMPKMECCQVHLNTLPFVRFPQRRTPVEWFMSRRRHIFHNCLDRLPREFRR